MSICLARRLPFINICEKDKYNHLEYYPIFHENANEAEMIFGQGKQSKTSSNFIAAEAVIEGQGLWAEHGG